MKNPIPVIILACALTFQSQSDGQYSSSLTLIGKTDQGTYYYSTKHPMNWVQAQVYCAEYGFQLATITSQEEQDVIDRLAASKTEAIEWTGFWLGGVDNELNNDWQWLETGEPLTFTNWAPGDPVPSTGNGSSFPILVTRFPNNTGKWETLKSWFGLLNPLCMLRRGDGCPATSTVQPVTIPTNTTVQPSTITSWGNDIITGPYKLYIGTIETGKVFYAQDPTVYSWQEAVDFCERQQEVIASIETDEEWTFIKGWLSDKAFKGYWIQPYLGSVFEGNNGTLSPGSIDCVFAHEGKPLPVYNTEYLNNPMCHTTGGHPLCMSVPG